MFEDTLITTTLGGNKMLTISNGLTDKTLLALEEYDFSDLKINDGEWPDLSFLIPFKHKIHELDINEERVDCESLKHLTELKALYISEAFDLPLDFSHFQKLNWFQAHWHKNYDTPSFYNLPCLKYLWIYGWKDSDCQKLSNFNELKFLELYNSRILTSLKGIERMPLVNLYIGACSNLTDISAIRGKDTINALNLITCKRISDYDPVGTLKNLLRLNVIESAPLKHLETIAPLARLQEISLHKTTIEDGDLNTLFQIPSLRHVIFTNKRNFSHTKNEVMSFLEKERAHIEKYKAVDPGVVLLGHKPICT